MKKSIKCFAAITCILAFVAALPAAFTFKAPTEVTQDYSLLATPNEPVKTEDGNEDVVKKIEWMEFNVPVDVMKLACKYDVDSQKQDVKLSFVELIAYAATRNGNNFKYATDKKNIDAVVARLKAGEKMQDIVGENKYYNYYLTTYGTVLKNFVGAYTIDDKPGYGVKAYYPLAKGYYATEYDDFGQRRNFGFARPHQGHDMMGSIGTPVVAMEGGKIVELGWNRYGGWRIGILSEDQGRFYYYAHLRKNKPYAEGLKMGDTVAAGQVIGYMGVTGYSYKENTNMTCNPHLHVGIQALFEPGVYDSNNEVWVDVYQITQFLVNSRAKVVRNQETKEYISESLKKPVLTNVNN